MTCMNEEEEQEQEQEQKGSANPDMQITEKISKAIDSWSREVTGCLAEKQQQQQQQNLDCSAIEHIANGLEKMVHCWSLGQEERAQEYARVAGCLEENASQVTREADKIQNTLDNIQLLSSVGDVTGDEATTCSAAVVGFSSDGNGTSHDINFPSVHTKGGTTELTGLRTHEQYMDDTMISSANYWCLVSESLTTPTNAYSFLENNSNTQLQNAAQDPILSHTGADHIKHRFRGIKTNKDSFGGAENVSKDGNFVGLAFDCNSSDVRILLSDSKAEGLAEILSFGTSKAEGENRSSQLKDTEFSGHGCQASVSFLKEIDDTNDVNKAKLEELQIALLERTMEYEVKMVEMEMRIRQLKSNNPSQEHDMVHTNVTAEKKMELALVPETQAGMELRRVNFYRKQNCKLQREKDSLLKETMESKKKLRQFDIQRRNLEDALQRVNFLQRELLKKEDELIDCQLREKATRAKLYQVEMALQKSQATKVEPVKLLKLVPALHEWFNSIRKAMLVKCEQRQFLQAQQCEENLLKILEDALSPGILMNLSASAGFERGFQSQSDGFHLEKVVCNLKEVSKEVQALENELEKLANRRTM